jgi:malate dehydrogenase
LGKYDIAAKVIGGHGDTTMVPLVEKATVNGLPLSRYLSDDDIADIVEKTMKGGAILTKMLGTSAWEAPAQGICETVQMIAFDENYTVASSVYREDFDLCIGTLVNIGENGITDMLIPTELSEDEKNKYVDSVNAIRKVNEAL